MTYMEQRAFLEKFTYRVKYGEHSHLTNYQGAFDLLDGRLENVGVIRDAKAAALRAFKEKCLKDEWTFAFEAGVITITKE